MLFPTKKYTIEDIKKMFKAKDDDAKALSEDRDAVGKQFPAIIKAFQEALNQTITLSNSTITNPIKHLPDANGGVVHFLNGTLVYSFSNIEVGLTIKPDGRDVDGNFVFRARQEDRQMKGGQQRTSIVWFQPGQSASGNLIDTNELVFKCLAWIIESQVPDVTF